MEKQITTREDIIPYETICNNHNQITHMLKQYKKTGDLWYIDQSIKLVRFCKKQGQRLEKRCTAYRDAIINLGFKRVYKSTKK